MHRKGKQQKRTKLKVLDLRPKKDAKGGIKQNPGQYINPDGTIKSP